MKIIFNRICKGYINGKFPTFTNTYLIKNFTDL